MTTKRLWKLGKLWFAWGDVRAYNREILAFYGFGAWGFQISYHRTLGFIEVKSQCDTVPQP